ncbi:MAG: hypothetical protein GXO33_02935 [Epsilonproteobacteria bacterium]|nr:hypothetical protein [Campylobacterota bacterium]
MDSSEWIRRFKIALIEENDTALAGLIGKMPPFDDIDEARQAASLIDRARQEITAKRERLKTAMAEIKKTRKFLTSSGSDEGRFDITS